MNNPYYNGRIEDLARLGNVSGELPQRKIIPVRCSHDLPELILKEYVLEEMGKQTPSAGRRLDAFALLAKELKKGNMNPLSGLGFSILSHNILNVCRWDLKYIDVVVPQIYTFEEDLWVPQKVEIVGAFCSEEKKVYDYENNAWLRYLSSKRTNQDKFHYLNDFFKE